MGERYAAVGTESTTTTGYTTMISIIGSTTVRPRLYDVMWGFGGTPADNAMFVNLQRSTAVGTAGTANLQDAEGNVRVLAERRDYPVQRGFRFVRIES